MSEQFIFTFIIMLRLDFTNLLFVIKVVQIIWFLFKVII